MCPPDIFTFPLVFCKRKICDISWNILAASFMVIGHNDGLEKWWSRKKVLSSGRQETTVYEYFYLCWITRYPSTRELHLCLKKYTNLPLTPSRNTFSEDSRAYWTASTSTSFLRKPRDSGSAHAKINHSSI